MGANRLEMAVKGELSMRMKSDTEPKGQLLGVRQGSVPDGMPFMSVCIHTDPFFIETKRANSHLSLCRVECVSSVQVAPPAAG